MDMPRRDERPGRRVRFVVVPDNQRLAEIRGVRLPPYGVFLDAEGQVIPLVVDDTDPFRRMTAGMVFNREEAARALKGPLLHGMTDNEGRRRIHRQIQCSKGFPRHADRALHEAIADFNRPMWGACGFMPHLHVFRHGELITPAKHPERVHINSVFGAGLALLTMLDERLITLEDCERLIDELARGTRFEWLPVDPPMIEVMAITLMVG